MRAQIQFLLLLASLVFNLEVLAQSHSDEIINGRALAKALRNEINQASSLEEIEGLVQSLDQAGLLTHSTDEEVIIKDCAWSWACGGQCTKVTTTIAYHIWGYSETQGCRFDHGSCEETYFLGCGCNYSTVTYGPCPKGLFDNN